MEDDVILIKECQSGSISAFDEIVRTYREQIFGMAYQIIGNFEDANDISQEVFICAYRYIKTFRGDASLLTWLRRIAINLSINHIKRETKRRQRAQEILDNKGNLTCLRYDTPLDIIETEEFTCRLRESIKSLPLAERVVFVLRVQQGLSYKEIADTVKCPMGTVMSRLNRARRRLRDKLKDYII